MNPCPSAPRRRKAAVFFCCLYFVQASNLPADAPSDQPCPASVSLRMNVSTEDGFSATVPVEIGQTYGCLRLVSEPGSAPRAMAGVRGPLVLAGPVRANGFLKALSDPCADAYLFTGAWRRPLALEMEAVRSGFLLGDAAGVWGVKADAPSMGFWAGTPERSSLILGCAAGCSLLPARDGFDSWFSEEPYAPERLDFAGMAWAGYGFRDAGFLASAALSEEDRGARGWALRGEGEFHGDGFRWNGRFSCASPEWKGLEGDTADRWEARSDFSWLSSSGLRLQGRLRAGVSFEGEPDWEGLARAIWSGARWKFRVSLEGADREQALFARLEPELYAEYEEKALRAFARWSCIADGADLERVELSGTLALGASSSLRLRLEGSYQWTADAEFWKTRARIEVPSAAGSWFLSLGTADWTELPGDPVWEFEAGLRFRIP